MRKTTTKRKERKIGVSISASLFRLWFAAALAFSTAAGEPGSAPVSRTIEGVVVDRAGSPVPGAVVLVKDLKSLQVRSYIAQEDGKYHFHGLSSDANYQLRAQFNGVAGGAKSVSVFDSRPTVVVNLKVPVKRPQPPK